MSSRVLSKADQLPEPGSPDDAVLQEVYRFFDGRKHAFELLASRVAAAVMDSRGGTYSEMWLTRSGGDGGMDFVGRLDVGQGVGSSPLVVLGQAKCIIPDTGISPDQVARLVARLRRGWVGVFVTTGVFSRQAQVEIVDDSYPVVLVSGRSPGRCGAEDRPRVVQRRPGRFARRDCEPVPGRRHPPATGGSPVHCLT